MRKFKDGDILKIVWRDCCSGKEVPVQKLMNTSPKKLLPVVITFGLFLKQDNEAITILNEYEASKIKCDYTCIPLSLIQKIQVLK